MATILYTSGAKEEVRLGSDNLEQIQSIIGGYMEIVYLSDGRLMIVNEDSIMKRLPQNPEATKLWGYPILGTVLVCNRNEFEIGEEGDEEE